VPEGDSQPIRAAATVILWREGAAGPEVLMGQRGLAAAFMPSKFVFPGGAVDADDHLSPLPVDADCVRRLRLHSDGPAPEALVAAALRELDEETGLRFAADGQLRFVFRAITPPGRTRRFDARFFLAPADHAQGDAVGFSGASGELSLLHWVSLADVRRLDLPFITEVVLAEVAMILAGGAQPGVPFFDNSGAVPTFRRLV
jgi:8-oxo-dGTP pyrophosphatase MutT (NUDIX family)